MGYFFLEYDHEQSFNFDTKKDKEKSVSWREFFCKYNGVIFICFDHQFILNRHKQRGKTFCIMRLLVFFIYFASWELFIIGPDENCSFPAFFDCVNKVAFNNLYCFFCCYIVGGKHVKLQVFTL